MAQAPGAPRRVLLVEDNEHITELYAYALKKLGKAGQPVELVKAGDGYDALAKLGQASFDLVVADLYMPVLDGFELIKSMRADPRLRPVPVLVITAGEADAQERAVELGANLVLHKPVRLDAVLAKVRALLGIAESVDGAPVP